MAKRDRQSATRGGRRSREAQLSPNAGDAERKPSKLSGRVAEDEDRDEGPLGWFLPLMVEKYVRLSPRDEVAAAPVAEAAIADDVRMMGFAAPEGQAVLAEVSPTVWRDRLAEYKRRKSAAVGPAALALDGIPAPAIPGGRNWRPLGPSVVLNGQTVGNQPVAGRVVGLAIAPGGNVLYAASAAGGVFRSDNGGTSWRSLMDGFDIDPEDFASASLACGAIALDPADPERVYVGTGEGDTYQLFRNRIIAALPSYRGIGPIRSDDGGLTWHTEPTASTSPELAGEAFFAMAIDPRNRDHVLAATTQGIYQRTTGAGGDFEWVMRRQGVHSAVVCVSSNTTTRFYASEWEVGVFHSADGINWSATGNGFPNTNVGRIALGVQANNPDLLYAFVSNRDGGVRGVYRLDSIAGDWKEVKNAPNVLPGKQGYYDLAIAVDPDDANLIYLGGDRTNSSPFPGAISRCTVTVDGTAYRVALAAFIGSRSHADVHLLMHTPGNANELWCGCDGGVFLNRNPRQNGEFAGRNDGLSCLCTNFLGQHPTDPNTMYAGLQDNGTAKTSSGPIWSRVSSGDGGYCLVNWAEPNQVLVFANGRVDRSTNDGATWSQAWFIRWATMTQPIVGPPFNPASPEDAKYVAIGAGGQVWVSKTFATSWPMVINLPDNSGNVFALAFASTTRLFMGTTSGRVFRADRAGNNWSVTRLDNAAAGPLGLSGLVTDVAVDWSDVTHASLYVVLGGMGDRRRIWRFDGTRWEVRSGTNNDNRLLDVEHNALAVDPAAPNNLYVGADIGVWHSQDSGMSWEPFQNGLPDAPVFDLQIHPTQRLLRAATYGRGIYEIQLT